MYNSDKPSENDLPSAAQLRKSTLIALVTAIAILVTVVLPAEYNIDPTGIGRLIGLTEMGEIKQSLAEEAEQDRQLEVKPAGDQSSWFIDGLKNLFVTSAMAQSASEEWRDSITFTLEPGEGIEWKLMMEKDGVAAFRWSTDGGRVNYDLHGDGGENTISYQKGRGTTGEEGEIVAAFTGAHGWFWRNRDKKDVTVTVQLRGSYSELKRTY